MWRKLNPTQTTDLRLMASRSHLIDHQGVVKITWMNESWAPPTRYLYINCPFITQYYTIRTEIFFHVRHDLLPNCHWIVTLSAQLIRTYRDFI